MKKSFKYFLFLLLLIIAVFTDGQGGGFSFSFLLCVSFSLYKKSDASLIICAFLGLFRDFLFFSLPYFSLIYLYISVGCVWCCEIFLGITSKRIALITFCAHILYFVCFYLVNAVFNADVFIEFKDIIYSTLSSIIAGVVSPHIFICFKRLKF